MKAKALQDLAGNGSSGQLPIPGSGTQVLPPQVSGSMQESEFSVDLRDCFEVAYRRRWIILTFLVGVFITTLIVNLTIKPVYRAEGRVEFNIQAPKVTKFEDVVASQLQTREFMQTQVELLKSASLANRVIQKLHLESLLLGDSKGKDEAQKNGPGLLHRLAKTLKGWLQSGGEEANDPARRDMIASREAEAVFAKKLEVQPQRDTTIVKIAFSSTNPTLTRNVVNTLIQEFISWRMDSKIESASTAKQQLEKQIQLARAQLEKSESNLNDFARKVGVVSLDPSMNTVYKQLEQTNKVLAEARTKRIEKEAAWRQVEEGDIASLPQIVESKLIQDLRKTYIDLQGEYRESDTTFKDDYPKQRNLNARRQQVAKEIAGEEARIATAIKKEYLTSLKEEQHLQKDMEEKEGLAMDLNDRAARYRILEREVETNKQIHQSLLERFKEIDATVGTDMTNIQVVDQAKLPLSPFKPNIRLNLLLAVVVGLMGGIGLAFVLEYLDNTVKQLNEISDRFRIAVLGVLPVAPRDEVKQLDYLVTQKPLASFSEAIRTTKVSIELSNPLGAPTRKLLFTSTCASEGKSTITCNIAQAFAASEERVIILDCDLRKPRLHRVFASNGSRKIKGLSQYLSGICAMEEVIRQTDIENLDFISAGPVPPNPAELLASGNMKQLLAMLAENYDRILIDGPPAAGFADVLVLGNQVDGIILVSTLGETHREVLRVLRKRIQNVQGCLLGAVVNKFSVGYPYGDYYKYYDYSYKAKEGTEQLASNAGGV